MSEAIEKLKALLQKKEKQYQSIEGEIASLEMQMRELGNEIAGVAESLRVVEGDAVSTIGQSNTPQPVKYGAMKTTSAVLDVVKTHGSPPGLITPEIIAKLKEGGFNSAAKELYSVVYSVAQRLVKQGKIKESKKGGKRSFMQ